MPLRVFRLNSQLRSALCWLCVFALLASSLGAFAQAGGTQGRQGQGQQGQQGQGQQQQQQEPPPTDPVRQQREELLGPRSQREQRRFALDPIGMIQAFPGSILTFRATVRDAALVRNPVTFSIEGAPQGAGIDPDTGVFSWNPQIPGLYTFNVVAQDTVDPSRLAVETVSIRIIEPLQPFGYSFFERARLAIQLRMQAVRQGLAYPGLPVAPHADPRFGQPGLQDPRQQQGGLQDQRQGDQRQGDQRQGDQRQGDQRQDGGQQGDQRQEQRQDQQQRQGQDQGGGQTQTQHQTQPPLQQHGYQPPVYPPYHPGMTAPAQLRVDALQYMVGPFDMMGANVFVPAPERYQLGPGDMITLRFWSPTQEVREVDIRIDQGGGINIPGGGQRVILRGQTLVQAEEAIRRDLRRTMRDADVTLALRELRTMSITVMGEAYLPGNYQMPAVGTLFNALYMFGGPSDNGSLRRIELRRTDGSSRVFDLYRFLVFGDSAQDVPLQPGDTIFIPPVDRRVTVKGEVLRPAIYELLPGERLRDALNFAGGARPSGVTQIVSFETVEPGVGRRLMDVNLAVDNPPVHDGDTIEIRSIRAILTNVVTLEGAVDQPGQYALAEGMTVADLLERARGLLPEAHLGRADLFRQNADQTQALFPIDLGRALQRDPQANLPLQVFDRLVVYRVEDVQWMGDRQVEVRGAVRRPGSFYRADNMRVSDLVVQARGLAGEALAEQGFLQRRNPDGTFGELVRIDFRRAMMGDPEHDVVIQDRDVLTVQTVQEARYITPQSVRILGAVQAPGSYASASNLRLLELIQLAGGTLPNAGDTVEVAQSWVREGTPPQIYRLSDVLSGSAQANIAIQAGDLVTIPARNDIMVRPRTVMVMGAVNNPGPYSINSTTDRLSSIIQRAGGLAPNAFPEGTQFLRSPDRLQTVTQQGLAPRVREILRIVNEEEYKRALARAEVEKVRLATSMRGGGTSVALPGLGGQVQQPPTGPIPEIRGDTVSPARPLREHELEPAGNINVNLPLALRNPGNRNDIILEEGDIIIVPETPTAVSVTGAVIIPSAVLYEPGRNLDYYVGRAGGYTNDAAKDRILIIRARGTVERATGRTRLELGDVIFVPTRVMAERLSDRQADIDTATRGITAAGVIFAIIRSLLR
jgi:protein involved in polysaccharide export with SLBB domain